jgi:hypothetical protein
MQNITIQVCDVGITVEDTNVEKYVQEMSSLLLNPTAVVKSIKVLKCETYGFRPIVFFELTVENITDTVPIVQRIDAINRIGNKKLVWEKDISSLGYLERDWETSHKNYKNWCDYSVLDTEGEWTVQTYFTETATHGMDTWYTYCPKHAEQDYANEDEGSESD